MENSLDNLHLHRDQILAWYDRHRREMPWRSLPGEVPDPYYVWLSEIMLQQTTVATVGPYFEKFIQVWPTLEEFAAAELDDVLRMWAGLGYYARARNMHKCARLIMSEYGGQFPQNQKQLLQLPGIGPYTSAAILAIAFSQPAVVVDGNVERVMARLFAIEKPLPQAKPLLSSYAQKLTPEYRPGDYAQAVMDLGATVCRPKKPSCTTCPWHSCCSARILGIEEQLPRKSKKPPKPHRRAVAFWLQRSDNKILLRQRPPTGLLGAMMEIPTSPWIVQSHHDDLAPDCDHSSSLDAGNPPEDHAPVNTTWQKNQCSLVRHTFTHFHLEIEVWKARVDAATKLAGAADEKRCCWVDVHSLEAEALPSLMRKVVAVALASV